MKKARIVTMTLCIAAAAIISFCLNIAGGIGMTITDRADLGIPLLISSAFLMAGTVTACYKRVWLPIIFNIIGTVCYIYTVSQIYAIPNSVSPKLETEPLAERHLFTVIVTVLLFALAALNYFDETNVEKRNKKRRLKAEKEERRLSDDEKII